MSEKYAICFTLFALYATDPDNPYADLDSALRSIRDRGFNTIRLDSGAGCFSLPSGEPRPQPVWVHPPFGRYSACVRQSSVIQSRRSVDLKARLTELLRAARKYDLKIILSSWMLIHTYWILDRSFVEPVFALSPLEKIAYFARELDGILSQIREQGMIDRVAFAEILNEFDGLDFCGGYNASLPEEEAVRIRQAHEKAIEGLRARHPDVLFAYDSFSAYPQESLIPRNIDVLNFHLYYLWNIIRPFENGVVTPDLSEPLLPPETRRWLVAEPVSVREIEELVGFRAVFDWARRVALHSSLDPAKLMDLENLLAERLVADQDLYRENLRRGLHAVLDLRARIVPQAELVMGEGVNYCCANLLTAEDRSDLYWSLLLEQAGLLREKGIAGTVVRTTADPEDPSWNTRKTDLLAINRRFLEGIL